MIEINKDTGSITGSILFLLALIAGVLCLWMLTCWYVVPPGHFGVRQITFGPGRGFSVVGLEPGFHWSLPQHSPIHVFPETVQILNFNRSGEDAPGTVTFGSLEINTTDGAVVDVDLSVLYRLYDRPDSAGTHGGPADLITNIGSEKSQWQNYIKRVVDDEIRRGLGQLAAGRFYDPKAREGQIRIAQAATSAGLAKYGIAVDALLLRRYTYRAEQIDRAIFSKNLQNQEERLNVASGKWAQAKAELERVAAEWDAQIKTLQVSGENQALVLRSKGELSEKENRALGDLEVAKAKAEIDKLRVEALAHSAGAEIFVAREMTPLLGSLKGGVVSSVDPYDLDAWMKRLGSLEGK